MICFLWSFFHIVKFIIIITTNKIMTSKLKWTSQEESYLLQIREEVGSNSWMAISHKINSKFADKNRTGKQCRDRFLNYLQFPEGESTSSWNEPEMEFLFKSFLSKGPKWSLIANELPGRSENSTKNKFYSTIRRFVRCLNIYSPKKRGESLKPMKLESVCRILNLTEDQFTEKCEQSFKFTVKQIRQEIVLLALIEEKERESFQTEEIGRLAEKIKKLNSEYRTQLIKFYRKTCTKKRKEKLEISEKEENKFISCFESCSQKEQINKEGPQQNEINKESDQFHPSTVQSNHRFKNFGVLNDGERCHPDIESLLEHENYLGSSAQNKNQSLEKQFFEIIDEHYDPLQVLDLF